MLEQKFGAQRNVRLERFTMERITSRKNPLLMKIRKLSSGSVKARREAGEYLGDGVKLLEEALRWQAPLTTVVVSEGEEVPELPQGVRAIQVPRDVMETISPMNAPQGALFLARLPKTAPPDQLEGRRYLVLDGVQDPGNVGTIWRTADAMGADGLLLVNGYADPYGPKTVRASMGACFRLPVWEIGSEELCALLERSGLPLYATALRADTVSLERADLNQCAVIIGSEGQGVSQALLDRCGQTIRIPMRSRCESLNAAAAASIVLWEMVCQGGLEE